MTGCVQYCKKDQLILVKSQKFKKKNHNSDSLLRIKKRGVTTFFFFLPPVALILFHRPQPQFLPFHIAKVELLCRLLQSLFVLVFIFHLYVVDFVLIPKY